MNQISIVNLDLRSHLVGMARLFPDAAQKPPLGESTAVQSASSAGGLPGFSAAGLSGFMSAAAGTYDLYRRISAHPTAALVRGIITAPIVANTWRWTKRREGVPDEWLSFARQILDPLRQDIVKNVLRSLEFGWAGFGKVWQVENGRRILARLKPLLWDCTEILVNAGGNVAGLVNQTGGKDPVMLGPGKYFLYINDGEAGDPYGRSRHENIRQAWSESEQIRQRLAQYMKKVSGIVVQLHYPEGTSRDIAGADRPNQWLGQQVLDAVSAGRSVMFPNGFASTSDLQLAYELAGKSPWQLSAFDAPGADHAPGMKLILEYYDALIFRGWLRPERTGLEARHGSKADAQTHTDTASLDSDLIDRDIADAITCDLVDELLVLNFGKTAKGAVGIEPATIDADVETTRRDVLNALISRGDGEILPQIDRNALLDQLSIPRIAG